MPFAVNAWPLRKISSNGITKADKPLCFLIRGRVGNTKPEKEMGGAVCGLVPPFCDHLYGIEIV